MDLGIFLSSKKKKWCWALGPVLFLIIFYFSFSIYFKSVNNSLKERKFFIESMPVMNQKISVARTILEDFKADSTEADVIEMLNSRLNQMAQRANFTINSLSIGGKESKGSDKISIFNVVIKGNGLLSGVMDFFSETQSPERLFAVETTNIKAIRVTPEPFYNANFVFSYYNLQ